MRPHTARMRSLLFTLVLALTACASTPEAPRRPPVDFGQPFPLAAGEFVSVKGGIYSVEFVQVLEDSRCPMNARCVWAGNARIAVKVDEFTRGATANTVHAFDKTLELNTSEKFAQSAVFEGNTLGIKVELQGLEPMPMAGVPTKDYVATLVVTEVGE